jgi:mRNA interferase RelE/StbE
MYKVWMSPSVHEERKVLPGTVRQRIKQAIESLAANPRPDVSRQLRLTRELAWELRRIRYGHWRLIYAVDDTWQEVAVLAVRRRLPYNYADLDELLSEL